MFYRFLIALVTLAGCAHEETHVANVRVTLKNRALSAKEFLQLNQDDIAKLVAATRKGSTSQTLSLSGNRKAKCESGKCSFGIGSMDHQDLATWNGLLQRAQKSNQEEALRDGPLTLRCSAELCSADFFLQQETGNEIYLGKANVTIKNDNSDLFLQSFIRGLLGNSYPAD
jgi:hypothetical protein